MGVSLEVGVKLEVKLIILLGGGTNLPYLYKVSGLEIFVKINLREDLFSRITVYCIARVLISAILRFHVIRKD